MKSDKYREGKHIYRGKILLQILVIQTSESQRDGTHKTDVEEETDNLIVTLFSIYLGFTSQTTVIT